MTSEDAVVPERVERIGQLKVHLSQRGENWSDLFSGKQLIRAAINQTLVSDDATIKHGDEVAFFPPVTGG